MVCPWRPLNSDVLFRWSGWRLSLLTLSACFSGTSKGYGLVKYVSKASSIQARHVLEGYHFRCARKYAFFFSSKHSNFIFSLFDFRCARTYAQFFSSKHSSLIFHDSTSGARANTIDFSRQNISFWYSIIFTLISACFSGTSKGYGLVKYASKASSIQARHVLEGYQVRDGHTLDCDWLQHNRPVETVTSLHSKCLYVDQLPADYRDMAQFRRLFSKVVNPPYCQVRSNRPLLLYHK